MGNFTQPSEVATALGLDDLPNAKQATFYIGVVENTIRHRLSERGLDLGTLCNQQPYRAMFTGIVAMRVGDQLGPQISGRVAGIESTTVTVDDGAITRRWRQDASSIAESLSVGDWALLIPGTSAAHSIRPSYRPDVRFP